MTDSISLFSVKGFKTNYEIILFNNLKLKYVQLHHAADRNFSQIGVNLMFGVYLGDNSPHHYLLHIIF